MPIPEKQQNTGASSEAGFSLAVVLVFVGLIATIIAMSVADQRGAVARDEARAAGWHLTQVAKAARIYVRDRSLDADDPTGSPYHKSRLNTGQLITVGSLQAAGLLPANFPDRNALGQRVLIYAAKYPVNGNAADNATVASAYVFLENSAQTNDRPQLMQAVMEGAKSQGLMSDAPLFNGATNVSDACNGAGPSYANWDTGCLTLADVTQITGLAAFTPGSLIVPAWRAQVHDSRVVTRFPQVDNPSSATMLTALEMAPVIRNASGNCTGFVRYRNYAAAGRPLINSDLCTSETDSYSNGPKPPGYTEDAWAGDKRFDMVNLSGLDTDTVIAAPQHTGVTPPDMLFDISYRPSDADPDENPARIDEGDFITDSAIRNVAMRGRSVIYVSGNLRTDANVLASGIDTAEKDPSTGQDYARVMFMSNDDTTRRRVRVDHNINVENDLAVRTANIANVSTANLDNDAPGSTATVNTRASASSVNVGGTLAVADIAEVGRDCTPGNQNCGVVTQVVRINRGAANADKATFFNALNASQTVTVSDAGSTSNPSLVMYRAQGPGSIETQNITARSNIEMNSSVRIGGTTSLTQCTGACPIMREEPGDIEVE